MSLEFLPEFALLMGGFILVGVAVASMKARRWGQAFGIGAVGTALVLLAIASGRSERMHGSAGRIGIQTTKPRGLLPADDPAPGGPMVEARMLTLSLGGVEVSVVPSNRYVLSVDREPVLTLDSLASGLLVSCDVAGRYDTSHAPRLAARIRNGVVLYSASEVQTLRVDPHSLLVKERGREIFRVRYANARRIEVVGTLNGLVEADLTAPAGSLAISIVDGIRWSHAAVPAGTSLDLSARGPGRVDFERSGSIEVIPE